MFHNKLIGNNKKMTTQPTIDMEKKLFKLSSNDVKTTHSYDIEILETLMNRKFV